jgi:sigma-B regulation protein RsbU (phosphoserine phosphatase)
MQRHTLIVAVWAEGSGGAGKSAQSWADAILEHWPAHDHPLIEVTTPEVFAAGLQSAAPGTGRGPAGPILAVLGPDASGTTAFTLADHMREALAPGVLLLPELSDRHRRLHGGGLLIERWDANPAFLAAALYTLAERQGAVDELARELRISQSSHGGVRGEMDRIHEELNLAAMVQQEFLPKQLPTAAGLDFGALFRPASYVSGDIYDLVQLDEHHVGFFIADAVGHGVPAALLTMVISRSLRMTEAGPQGVRLVAPAEAMARLNNELIRSQRESPRFVTAVYGLIDTHTRQVTLAGAGHPPPLRIGPQGRGVKRVETDGPLLGVFADERYSQTSFTLEDDETLLLYSDGFETAFPGESAVGGHRIGRPTETYLEHLAHLASTGRDGEAGLRGAMSQLADALDRQAGSLHQIDDVTALAIAARGKAQQRTEPVEPEGVEGEVAPVLRAA